MEEQGYDMDPSVLHQDNMSVILLEKNGKTSSTKQTKHIKVKYFYIKENIDNGEIKIGHCPMGQMWTDINTKQKQGLVYRERPCHEDTRGLQQQRLQRNHYTRSPSQFNAASTQVTESIAGVCWG
jgi:hypothetical protein